MPMLGSGPHSTPHQISPTSQDMHAETSMRVSNYWDGSKKPRQVSPALDGDRSVDVAIIGAGYTGLSTAYHLKAAEPSLDVAILEGETVGFGASGRNAGFVMTLFGASLGMMKTLHGAARVREAHAYMERSIAGLETMVAEHKLGCDFERGGFLK